MDFFQRLDQREQQARNERIFASRPENLHDYQGCANQEMAKSCTDAVGIGRQPTLRDQAEKSVGYHRAEADKHDRAAAFLRENPAFDEFVLLVREGVIQF